MDEVLAELYTEGRPANDETAGEIMDRLEAAKNYIPSSDKARREYAWVLLREYRSYVKDRKESEG